MKGTSLPPDAPPQASVGAPFTVTMTQLTYPDGQPQPLIVICWPHTIGRDVIRYDVRIWDERPDKGTCLLTREGSVPLVIPPHMHQMHCRVEAYNEWGLEM